MNGKSTIGTVLDRVTFPSAFSNEDKEKFAGEVAAEAGRYLPEGAPEELVNDVSFSKNALSVKFASHKTKAAKGEKIQYRFRTAVWLACVQAEKLEKITGYSFPVDLTTAETFWSSWKRAEVTDSAPQSPAPQNP